MKILIIYFHNCKQFKENMFTRETLSFFKSIDDSVLNIQPIGHTIKMEYKTKESRGITSKDLKVFCNILGCKKYSIF